MIHQIDIFLSCYVLQLQGEMKLLIDHATTDKDNTTQDINGRFILFYIRKDYNLMWSVVTDIGNKHKQVGSKVPVFKKSHSTCCQHYHGSNKTMNLGVFILIEGATGMARILIVEDAFDLLQDQLCW
jgi:hypothetical protein